MRNFVGFTRWKGGDILVENSIKNIRLCYLFLNSRWNHVLQQLFWCCDWIPSRDLDQRFLYRQAVNKLSGASHIQNKIKKTNKQNERQKKYFYYEIKQSMKWTFLTDEPPLSMQISKLSCKRRKGLLTHFSS